MSKLILAFTNMLILNLTELINEQINFLKQQFRPSILPHSWLSFTKYFRKLLKKDLMSLFYDFYKENLPLFSLNFGIITLLSKIKDASQI
uniref:Uncharacterized protein n=1 Tax=Arundo donax TaxID=35708 RepID=A0A0A8YFF9_ARUDO